MPHQGYQISVGAGSLPPLEAKTQYWIRRQTGSAGTTMTDGTDTNCYINGGWSQGSAQASNTTSSSGWSFPGVTDGLSNKADAISFTLSHSHPLATTFKLTALSLGTITNAIVDTRSGDTTIGIFEGSAAGSNVLYEKTYGAYGLAFWGVHPSDPSSMWSRPNGATTYAIPDSGDSTTNPTDLAYGTTYTVAWGWGADNQDLTANRVANTVTTRAITTASGTITCTWSNSSFGGSAPWATSNGTSTSTGQIPIIGIDAN